MDKPSVTRTGAREYVADNGKGSTLEIGYGPGQFSPGDLLKLAVLGCNALSSDARFARVLGDDFEMFGSVAADYLEAEDRFTSFQVDLLPVMPFIDAEAKEQLLRRASKAIERNCTITHTVKQSAQVAFSIDGTPCG